MLLPFQYPFPAVRPVSDPSRQDVPERSERPSGWSWSLCFSQVPAGPDRPALSVLRELQELPGRARAQPELVLVRVSVQWVQRERAPAGRFRVPVPPEELLEPPVPVPVQAPQLD